MIWFCTFLFTFLPIYLIRFYIGPLPTTALEVVLWLILLFWFFKKIRERNAIILLRTHFKQAPGLFIAIFIFLFGATLGAFLSPTLRAAFGEWRAFYIEPAILFYILLDVIRDKKNREVVLMGLILCGLITSLLAFYQHFTGWLVPYSFWANRNTYRVTAWYGFPNGVGIFLAPLIPFGFYLIGQIKNAWLKCIPIFFIPAAVLAIIFAKSTGALIGLAAGCGLYLLLNKKTKIIAGVCAVVGFIGILLVPSTNPIKQELLAQDYSGSLRRDIWSETITYLTIHPFRGTGMAAYSQEITPYRHNKKIEVFHHPHNIFLTIWVNTGIIGLIGFLGILGWFLRQKNSDSFMISLTVAMVIWLTMGLVDSPYIKNDWALFFWFLIAMRYTTHNSKHTL
jgi:O-antigen ligase